MLMVFRFRSIQQAEAPVGRIDLNLANVEMLGLVNSCLIETMRFLFLLFLFLRRLFSMIKKKESAQGNAQTLERSKRI